MRKRANVFVSFVAYFTLQLLSPAAAFAVSDDLEKPELQSGEDRWVPSLSISGGAIFQNQDGEVDSAMYQVGNPNPMPLQGHFKGNDLNVAPFLGVGLEVMTPAFDIPTRPRLFLSAEILPMFATDRTLAVNGDPGCILGPEPGVPCATEEDGTRSQGFGEDAANGQGSKTTALIDTLAFGANLGVAFPFKIGKRQVRIKPSLAWINYEVDAEGIIVDAACSPTTRCTDITVFGFVVPGFLREATLEGSDSKRFNGIGPAIDLEMDAVRWGQLGVSLFLGGRAHYIIGNRKIAFGTSQAFNDAVGNDVDTANWEVEVDPWLFRAHVGIRFQWLGGIN